jgi:TIR domain-containing protein
MAQIFLSYRRSDSGYAAPILSEKLQQHFGENSVFFDVDTIPLGVDFRESIGNAVGQCDVLLAIIGDQWVRAVDKRGNRRLDDPSDFVRIEIESALKRNIPVIL